MPYTPHLMKGARVFRLLCSVLLFAAATPAQRGGGTVSRPGVSVPATTRTSPATTRTSPATATSTDSSAIAKVAVVLSTTDARTSNIKLSDVALQSEKVTLTETTDAAELLKRSGISEDVNSLSLFYDLNPTIDRLKGLPPGTVLRLPKIGGSEDVLNALNQGTRFAIVRDATALRRVQAKEVEIRKLSGDIAQLSPSIFERLGDKETLTNAVSKSLESLRVIASDQFAVSERVLRQTEIEARSLKNLVTWAARTQTTISRAVIAEAKETSEVLDEKSDDISSGGSGLITVEVRTLKSPDKTDVRALRVFYRPKADPMAVEKFQVLSSPAIQALPIANYFMWATARDEPTPAVTDTVPVKVRKNQNRKVELLVM